MTSDQSRRILITGCSSGIGLATARHLQSNGWHVYATCRKDADCERLRGEGLDSFPLDLDSPDSIGAAVEVVRDRGGLDALYNNGAMALPGAAEDLPRDGLRALFETNVFGLHDLTCRVIPLMRAQGHGRIINCSSIFGFVPAKWRGAYTASKYAVEGLTETLRLEMADTPIKVSLLQPGPVTTFIRANSIPHFERWIDWKNSARAKDYETRLLKRLHSDTAPVPFELPPEAVAKTIERILNSPNPKARYRVTVWAHLLAWGQWMLPPRTFDRVLAKF